MTTVFSAVNPDQPVIFGQAPRPGSTNLFDWVMALYIMAVSTLQATTIWYVSTWIGYGVLGAFLLSRHYFDIVRIASFWAILGCILWAWVAASQATHTTLAVASTWYFTKIMIFGLMIMIACRRPEKLSLYLKAMVVGSLFLAVPGALLGYDVVAAGGERMTGIAKQENAYGSALFFGFLAGMILLPMASWRWKAVTWLYFAAAFISLLSSGSRGAAVSVLAAIGAYFVLEYLRNLQVNIRVILPALALMAVFPLVAWWWFPDSPLVIRMASFVTGEKGADSGRFQLYEEAWWMFKSSPLFGLGFGTYIAYTGASYTHTTFLELLVAGGAPAFLLYYTLFVQLWWKLGRLVKKCKGHAPTRKTLNALRAVVLALVAHGAFQVDIYSKIPNLLLCAALGLAARELWQVQDDRYGQAEQGHLWPSP